MADVRDRADVRLMGALTGATAVLLTMTVLQPTGVMAIAQDGSLAKAGAHIGPAPALAVVLPQVAPVDAVTEVAIVLPTVPALDAAAAEAFGVVGLLVMRPLEVEGAWPDARDGKPWLGGKREATLQLSSVGEGSDKRGQGVAAEVKMLEQYRGDVRRTTEDAADPTPTGSLAPLSLWTDASLAPLS
jgi:hypothetical protein